MWPSSFVAAQSAKNEMLQRGARHHALQVARPGASRCRRSRPRRAPAARAWMPCREALQDRQPAARARAPPRPGNAARAAATAASTSAAPPADTSARCAPSIGERSANVSRDGDALAADPVLGRDLDARDSCRHLVLLRRSRPRPGSAGSAAHSLDFGAITWSSAQVARGAGQVEALVQLDAPAQRRACEIPRECGTAARARARSCRSRRAGSAPISGASSGESNASRRPSPAGCASRSS